MAHFEIKNLNFAYETNKDRRILRDINLKIEHGQYITICGKSGSGKTTLLRHLKSVLTPKGISAGRVLFNGEPLEAADLKTQSSNIGYVMQNPDSQIVTDKVWHELAFGLESLGYDQRTIRLRVAEMASYFGIHQWFHKSVNELSGGQKQLLNLASIMAMQPSVLILDEPTSQLDPIAAADFLNTVGKINMELGTTIIITEHRLEDVLYRSDKVIVMDNGKIIAEDEPRKIGQVLKESSSDMFSAMPTPVQVYYQSKGEKADFKKCPLTVREGRSWLTEVYTGRLIDNKVEDEELKEVTDPVISAKEIWFRYSKNGHDVLKGASLYVQRNDFLAIVGGNGTGKSTLLRSICQILKPYRGRIKTSGSVAMLPQNPQSLFVKKTVKEELEEMTKNTEHTQNIASLCQIESLFEAHPYDISGGEQQRVALAKVLLTKPDILLLDEPTKGLDNFFKETLANILKELQNKGTTIVMVSHDVEFCAKYADTVAMFFDGDVLTINTPHKFFKSNNFYTTAANRMSRHIMANAITNEDIIRLCKDII